MKPRAWLRAAILVGATALVTAEVVSQEKPAAPDAEPQAQPEEESPIDIWVRHAMPGEHHRVLGKLAGDWQMAVEYRMNADAPAVTSEGTCQRKWILGRRFVLEEFDGGSLGLPFQGLVIYGYDAFEDKYTSAWVDTMNTAITTSRGTCQEPCRQISFVGRHGDPWTGTIRQTHGLTRFVSDDQHVLELYEPDNSGREFKILKIVYTRQQPATLP